LRQLARLGRSVPFAGGRALAVAVYADGLDEPIHAQEAGYEGVACVDDAARALELYCDLWDATRLPWALRWCEGLVDFVRAMQDGPRSVEWRGRSRPVGLDSGVGRRATQKPGGRCAYELARRARTSTPLGSHSRGRAR